MRPTCGGRARPLSKTRAKTRALALASLPLFSFVLGLLSLAACGKPAGGPGGPGGPGGAQQALPVQIEAVRETDIAEATEYLATVKSRHSVNVQPQIEGVVTRIFVQSGDRVAKGAPLLQIDPLKQQATVRSQEATREMKRAAMEYARQQKVRMESLAQSGVVSRQSADEAAAAYDQARADYQSLGAQVEEQAVELRYYRVAAPAAGVVGDIPVRVGDRVTTATLLTTLDDHSGLEAYVSIPLTRSQGLRLGLPVEIRTDRAESGNSGAAAPGAPGAPGTGSGGGPIRSQIGFISPQADDATQSVLVKVPLPADRRDLRPEQAVGARVIWSQHRGPVVPVLAVTRASGQFFAFVAQPGGP
ncbi:MAG TPA: efflux RND transporter periplasmic adaptor subunit, partial [Thermoanaerobaculia bacterium]|nr:efflux RND transporter periplasmic adaptor subunit [Thermoanaerobaculia bacterium]